MWKLGETEPLSGNFVEPGTLLCEPWGTLGNLNLYVKPLWNLEPFKCGTIAVCRI